MSYDDVMRAVEVAAHAPGSARMVVGSELAAMLRARARSSDGLHFMGLAVEVDPAAEPMSCRLEMPAAAREAA